MILFSCCICFVFPIAKTVVKDIFVQVCILIIAVVDKY